MRLDFRAFRQLARGRFWKDLWDGLNDDHCWGMAAELSYYFLLAFFPFLIFISAIVAVIPLEGDLLAWMLNDLHRFLPGQTFEQVREIVGNFTGWSGTGVALLWALVALWAASLGLNGMVGVLNRAYRVKDQRSYFRVRALSIVVTVAVSLFIILSGALLFFGESLLAAIAQIPFPEKVWLPWGVKLFYSIIRWTLVFLFLNLGIQIVYYALPARRLPWRLLSPGSVFVALGWLLGSLAFSYYINSFANYQRMYGTLGDLIVLMIWFYYSSLFLLIGGEMDSEIFRVRRERRRTGLAKGPAKPAKLAQQKA